MFDDIKSYDRSTITLEIGRGGEGMTPIASRWFVAEAQLPTKDPLARGRKVRRAYSCEDSALLDEYTVEQDENY